MKTLYIIAFMLVCGYAYSQNSIVIQEKDKTKTSTLSDNPNKPLYVLDGVKLATQTKENADELSIDDIDPSDIESVNVLKGELATDKYGEEGKNGVIVITTKDPKKYQKK